MVEVYVYEGLSGTIGPVEVAYEVTVTLPAIIYEYYFDHPGNIAGTTDYCLASATSAVWSGHQAINVPAIEMQRSNGTWVKFLAFWALSPGGHGIGADLGDFNQTLKFRIAGQGLPGSSGSTGTRTFTLTFGFADSCSVPFDPPPEVSEETNLAGHVIVLGRLSPAQPLPELSAGRAYAQIIG